MTTQRETTVRRYAHEDIEHIVDCIVKYVPELPNYIGIEISKDDMRFTLENNFTNGGAIDVHVLCDHNGKMIGGVGMYCVKLLFSKARMTSDIFLFLLPEHRTLINVMKLIDSYKAWSIVRGAKIIQATHTGGYKEAQMEKLLARAGFNPIGTIYRLMPQETKQ